MNTRQTTATANIPGTILVWATEVSPSFNFSHLATVMEPDELAQYRKGLLQEVSGFFSEIAGQDVRIDNAEPLTPSDRNLSHDVILWAYEHYDEWDFAHAQANMLPDEFEQYRKRTIQEAVSFFQGLAN